MSAKLRPRLGLHRSVPAALLGAGAAALITTTVAVAGSGVGGVFNLGQTNTVNARSTLTGSTAGSQLMVSNTSTDEAATALNLVVSPGQSPFKVNSPVKVANLNADRLDGIDSTSFWKLGGNALGSPGVLGTTTNQPLELKVNGQRALRLEPAEISPNLIGGGPGNSVTQGAIGATIAGGRLNLVTTAFSSVGGGDGNQAGGAPGGVAYTLQATVAGGQENTASGYGSAIAGGVHNTASGAQSAVPGGQENTASGNYSLAAGLRANAAEIGSFVWGDSTSAKLTSPDANTFTVRASGGIWLGTTSSPTITAGHFIDTSTGGFLTSTGVWTNASDRALKHDFRRLDKHSLLEKVARMPITSWSYKAEQPSIRHIGPMAQDFYSAFGLGLDDKHIATIDEGGVALAAIQGLYRQNKALQRENRVLSSRLARLEGEVAELSR
jgi:Chaperone of endosialidase